MTPLPLKQIGPHWRDHLSALWWLGTLYRHPSRFEEQIATASKWQDILRMTVMLYLHIFLWIVIISVMGRFLLFGALGMELQDHPPTEWSALILLQGTLLVKGILVGSAIGMMVGAISGIMDWFIFGNCTHSVDFAITLITLWITCTLGLGVIGGVTFGVGFGNILLFIVLVIFMLTCLKTMLLDD